MSINQLWMSFDSKTKYLPPYDEGTKTKTNLKLIRGSLNPIRILIERKILSRGEVKELVNWIQLSLEHLPKDAALMTYAWIISIARELEKEAVEVEEFEVARNFNTLTDILINENN